MFGGISGRFLLVTLESQAPFHARRFGCSSRSVCRCAPPPPLCGRPSVLTGNYSPTGRSGSQATCSPIPWRIRSISRYTHRVPFAVVGHLGGSAVCSFVDVRSTEPYPRNSTLAKRHTRLIRRRAVLSEFFFFAFVFDPNLREATLTCRAKTCAFFIYCCHQRVSRREPEDRAAPILGAQVPSASPSWCFVFCVSSKFHILAFVFFKLMRESKK